MNTAILAVAGAIAAGAITAAATMGIAYYQRTSALRDAHRLRAFERHLADYERIFAMARSVLDALNDYLALDRRVIDRSDPFLHQLLDILSDASYQYCAAVDWRRNTAMAYLDIKLEERCLHLRDLLLQWLSGDRTSYGDVVSILRYDRMEVITARQVKTFRPGDYRELRVERRAIVTSAPGDAKLAVNIRSAATSVIRELKNVMAY
jgi:uncharacterized coiled-coil protein SlyX